MTDDRFASPGWFLRPDKWHEWMPNVPWMNGLASPEPRQLPAPFPLKWEQGPNGGLTAWPSPLPNPDGSYWWVSINPMQHARGNSDAASPTSLEPGWAPARMPPRWEQGPNGGLTARPSPLPNPDGSYWWESINPMQHARGNAGVAPPINVESASAPISTTEDLLRTTPAALARGTTLALRSTGDARELAGKGITWALQKAGIEPTLADLLWYRNPNAMPVRQLTEVGLSGLEAVGAPNLASLLRGEPPPPYRHADGSTAIVAPDALLAPNAAGKVPSPEDPRPFNAAIEVLELGANVLPVGGFGGAVARAGARAAAKKAMPPAARIASSLPRQAAPLAPEMETLASRSARLYDPPVKPQRPFEADYPLGAPADVGRLTRDIEGRPLGAQYVIGRRMVGGGDEALSPAQYGAVTQAAIGSIPEAIAAGALPRGTVGAYRVVPGRERAKREIGFVRSLNPQSAEKVVAHEMGHMIDELAGNIPTAGLSRELAPVYNTLNTGQERGRLLTGPQHVGYQGADVPKELMAEAIRAYMADPNYLKTVAPKTAAAIRAAVNSHPTLSKIIQFNTLAAPAYLGEFDRGALPIPKPTAPVL